jgi:hypothetical protein
MVNDHGWKEPEFKGLTLAGTWRDCPAMLMAQQRGSEALEESDLWEQGCSPDTVDRFLSKYWIEHDINAVMNGAESVSAQTLSLVRQSTGYFQVRLFSTADQPPDDTPESLLRLWQYVSIRSANQPARDRLSVPIEDHLVCDD